jgi:uncharacterized protein (TIGR03083 family)
VDAETSWRVIEHERLSLAALLADLNDERWNDPSLCDGWRVKDVAAHVALAPQAPSPLTMVVETVRAGGRFHKINGDFAIRHAERPGADLVAELRTHAASRRLPKVTNYRNIVVDMLVHGQYIAIPLGIRREMPPDAARAGIERVWTMGWPFGVNRPRSLTAVVGRRCRRTVQPGQTVAAPRRTSDRTMAAVANSPENTRFSTVCLRGVCSHFSRRTERPV